jgi:Flp pilus assembly protein TadB
MTALPLVLGGITGALALQAAAAIRPRPALRTPVPTAPAVRRSLAAGLGRVLLRAGRRRQHQPDPGLERTVGRTALAMVVALPVLPPLAVAIGAGSFVRHRLARVRRGRDVDRAVADTLPDAVELLLLCCGAGIALPLAQPLVGEHLPAPVGPALLAAEAATAAGLPRADGLHLELGRLGDRATALAHVLSDHLRYGVALAPALERLGLELRLDRRRRAEQDARRVPLRLLGPLITCVLPAFGLLTVVPLLVASLQSLPT